MCIVAVLQRLGNVTYTFCSQRSSCSTLTPTMRVDWDCTLWNRKCPCERSDVDMGRDKRVIYAVVKTLPLSAQRLYNTSGPSRDLAGEAAALRELWGQHTAHLLSRDMRLGAANDTPNSVFIGLSLRHLCLLLQLLLLILLMTVMTVMMIMRHINKQQDQLSQRNCASLRITLEII